MTLLDGFGSVPLGFKHMRTLLGHQQRIRWIAWSPNGQMRASSSEDRSIRLWDAAIGRVRQTLNGHAGIVYCVAWSPDGRLLASASDDHTVRLWDAETGQQIATLKGHSSPVYCCESRPGGRRQCRQNMPGASHDGPPF